MGDSQILSCYSKDSEIFQERHVYKLPKYQTQINTKHTHERHTQSTYQMNMKSTQEGASTSRDFLQLHLTKKMRSQLFDSSQYFKPPSEVLRDKQIEDLKMRIRQENNKQKVDKALRRNLSNQCKDNFIQFLMVQKSGHQGDNRFFEMLKKTYKKQLYSQLVKKPLPIDRRDIAYLQKREEKPESLQQQVQQILERKQRRKLQRVSSPLDGFIKNMDENLPTILPPIHKTQLNFLKQRSLIYELQV